MEYKNIDFVPLEYQAHLKPFELIGSKFYYIGNAELNWFQAVQECRKKGGNLINLKTHQETLVIGMQLNASHDYWVDINRLGQEEYVSITTGLRPDYLNFLAKDMNEVNDYYHTNEQLSCVTLVKGYEDSFVMKETKCMEKSRFICQLSSPRTISIVVW